MSSFLQKQGHYLLHNQLYASIIAATLAFIPFSGWLSLALIALVTLRKGSYNGLKILIVGIAAAVIAASRNDALPYENIAILATFSIGYIAAILLRTAASWKVVVGIVLTISLLVMALIHWLAPEYILEQFHALLAMFRKIEPGGAVLRLLDGKHGASQEILANYLLGIQVFSIVFSALSSVMLARYIQSMLFYPGGFREEILAFRASRTGVFMLVISAVGVYQHYPVAISFLPILVVYLMAAGMSLFFKVMSRKKDLFTILLLIAPLVVVPYVMLPVYVLFGSLDSLFNFRLRLLSKAGE